MTAIPKRKLTEEQYLAIERAAEFKSEYYDGEMFAMAGASYPHNRIKDNLHGELYIALRNGPCKALTSDMRVKAANSSSYSYPDLVVLCGEPKFTDAKKDTLLNPRAIIEVLSPSTEDFNRGGKRRRYQMIESLQEYVLVAQDRADIERYVRQTNGNWEQSILAGLDATLEFPSLEVSIPVSAIYAGVTFPEQPDE
jgi:Uma2 family endonuclease